MICPFMELTDPRCADHFSLTRLSDAFTHCVGRYQACPVYHRLVRDQADPDALAPPAAVSPLRPGRLAG